MKKHSDKKRVLIITYYWPPSGGSGVQRWLKFAKYLPGFGWHPVIFTPLNPDFGIQDPSLEKDIPQEAEIIKTKIWEPYQIYRLLTGNKGTHANFGMTGGKSGKSLVGRFSLWVRGNLFVPDPRVYWRKPSFRFLKHYLRHHHLDAIITTGPPHSMHLIGLDLKKHFPQLPWIADMRDPWSTFDIHNAFLSASAKRKNAALERSVLKNADKVIMVSPSLKDEFQPFDHSSLALIPNGFDKEDFKGVSAKTNVDGKFKIYHSGLFNFIRNPENLWKVLEAKCASNASFFDALALELIGTVDSQVMDSINQYPLLAQKVRMRSWMPHDEVLAENSQASVLLILVNNSRNAKAQLTGKLFEYMALGKPILAICPEDADLAVVLKETGSGISCAYENFQGMTLAIDELFTRWQEGKTEQGISPEVDAYSRKSLTGQLVNLLEDAVFSSPPIATHQ